MLLQITKKINSAPKGPGVYIFYQDDKPLYVGKASNLKNRLQSYLRIADLKTEALHKETTDLELIKLRSNIEALIEESRLIKELKPRYNILWRDDKNYFYAAITKEKFPRIFITHQILTPKPHTPTPDYIGPFTEGNPLKAVLRLLRKKFPYCGHNSHFRICLDSQINNCPGYCCQRDTNIQMHTNDTNNTNIKKYRKNIAKIKNILTGKDKKFIRQLKDPYELLVLEKIWAHEPYLESSKFKVLSSKSLAAGQAGGRAKVKRENQNLETYNLNLITNVECYDNSHLSGKEAVGAMTRWESNVESEKSKVDWTANESMWRKFRIRGNYTEDDPRMMEEIVSRRLNHPEWPYPDLIIIDGGITQFCAATKAFNNLKAKSLKLKAIKIISFAKPNQEVYGLKPLPVPITELPEDFQKIIRMAIQNTHNFVIRYHRKVRQRQFLKSE